MSKEMQHDADSLMNMFWEWMLLKSPEFATSVGVHKYDDRLDELSINSIHRMEKEAKTLLNKVKDYLHVYNEESRYSRDDVQLNLNLIVSDLEQFIDGMRYKPYLCAVTILEGPHSRLPKLLSQMKRGSVEDMKLLIARLRLFKQQVDETISLLKEGRRLGFVLHKVSIQPLPKVLQGIGESPVEASPIFKPFVEKPTDVLQDEWVEIVSEAKSVITYEINPLYIQLAEFIRHEYLNHTRPAISASSLPNGEGYYAACLRFHTTTNLTAREIHDIGIKEVARITRRLQNVKEQVNYKGELDEFLHYLRTAETFKFKNSAEILDHYKNTCERIEKKLHSYFETVPKARFEVEEVPDEEAPFFPMALYEAPPCGGDRPGTFYVNTSKPEMMKKYDVLPLCLHEAMPGHHLQICLTMESEACPEFRRFNGTKRYNQVPAHLSMGTAYLEGWGLYAEYLGEEMGLYADPFELIGRLCIEMWRACRLVVDTGMHAFQWKREEAIKYMENNTLMDIHQIEVEIDRYITEPGQACAYKMGELKIKELRNKAEERLGEKFSLKLFHQTVASMGAVPLDILEKQIDIFIQKQLV